MQHFMDTHSSKDVVCLALDVCHISFRVNFKFNSTTIDITAESPEMGLLDAVNPIQLADLKSTQSEVLKHHAQPMRVCYTFGSV